jgi:Uma2 family endonuclease
MSTATRITVADYDRMIAEGFFARNPNRQRIELIDGELRPMGPIGPAHEHVVDILSEWSLTHVPAETVRVRNQHSIGIAEFKSVPEPDIAFVVRRSYAARRPQARDVFLIIEVADSSLGYDRDEKATLFAAAGIADYWVVNIPDRCVEVFRRPEDEHYRSHEAVTAPNVIHPLAFPHVALCVAKLFAAD